MPNSRQKRSVGIFFILMNVVFWGIAPAIIKQGLDQVSPQVFLYYRFLIVMLLTTPFLFFMRSRYTIKKPKDLFMLLGIGLLTNPISLGILFVGLRYTTSSAAAIIAATAPLFIIVSSAIFLKEKITKYEALGALLATAGTMLIILETPEQAHAPNPLLGNSLVLLQNVIWAGAVLLMKKFSKKYPPFLFGYTGWFTGLMVMGVVSYLTDPVFVLRPLILTQLPEAFAAISYMAVFGSIIAFTAYQIAQKHLDASEVSIFTYLQPVVAIPLSIFWLHERFDALFIVGVVVLVFGVLMAELHSDSRIKRLSRRAYKK